MKKLNISLMLAGAVALGATTSCMDNLEIEQHGVLNYDTYYQTDDEIEAGIVAVYIQQKSMMQTVHLNKECLTGDFWSAGGVRGDNTGYEELNEFRFTSEHSGIQGWFSAYYTLIAKSNIVIDRAAASNSEVAARAIAEAKVFRAWSYFELTTMWGTPPLVLHELVDESEYKIGNTEPEILWAQIETDLSEAIASGKLSEKSNAYDNKTWRITKQYAQALLGKAYLWQNKYKDAAEILDQVISSNKYALYGQQEGEKFEDVLQMTAKNNCESLFESQQVIDESNAEFNLYGAMLRWRFEKFDMTADFKATYYTGQDYGFMNPTQDLYDAFCSEEIPGKYGSRFLQTIKTVAEMADMGGKLKNGKTVHGCEGYYMWKWRAGANTDNPGLGMPGFTYCNNFRWMRYAEVLLLAAEAHMMNNNAGKAAEYINMIRKRAKVDEQKNSYTIAELMLEKRLELCGEMTHYQDMQRWAASANGEVKAANQPAIDNVKSMGDYCPILYSNGTVEKKDFVKSVTHGYKEGKHELLPFPYNEKRLNSNLEQNPNWN